MNNIITIPAFSDNYIWLISDITKQYWIIVDPGDPSHLIPLLEKEKITPIAIIITHFHYDHGNGIPTLLEHYPGLVIYAPKSEYELLKDYPNYPYEYGPASNCFKTVKEIDYLLEGDEEIYFDEIGIKLQVMSVPGHTSGHIAYYLPAKSHQSPMLFCGDTLFAAGCGRVFNGTLEDLHQSLQKIAQLPDDTRIYCAHEYTLDNIGFAKWVEPENIDLLNREEADMALIDSDQATVPFTLAQERKTNPFLRTHLPHVAKRVAEATGKTLNSSSEVFSAMRIWKDSQYD